MKKNIILKVIMVVFVIALVITPSVFADIPTTFPSDNNQSIDKIDVAAQKVWGTVTTIVQMLAFAAIVFAGLRYMFASADQKADIKKGLGMLTIGAILVFAASTVVQFVVKAGTQVIKVQ